MQTIYFDQGATSYPKPDCVPDAILHFIRNIGCNINRGTYENAYEAEDVIFETRQLHYAPAAHKTLDTYPEGTLRFSFGFFNTREEIDQCVRALEEIYHGI